jgi:hypothetical protein
MNYINYQTSIVLKYRVRLVGWPLSVPSNSMPEPSSDPVPEALRFAPMNPGHITSLSDLQDLTDALKAGLCKWVKMAAIEYSTFKGGLALFLNKNPDHVKARKPRSDKGTKRPRKNAVQVPRKQQMANLQGSKDPPLFGSGTDSDSGEPNLDA